MKHMHMFILMLLPAFAHSASEPAAKIAEQAKQEKRPVVVPAEEKRVGKKVDSGPTTWHQQFPPPPPGTIYHTYHYPFRPEE